MNLSISFLAKSCLAANAPVLRPFLQTGMGCKSGAAVITATLVLLSASSSAAPRGKAGRATTNRAMGPSALAAARLKDNAPRGWLNHYLPADRFKIQGGIWKYVSTELDTFYHRPDSPLMLEQPAGIVIGFDSIASAEEAGYLPGPGISPRLRREALDASPLFAGRAVSSPGDTLVINEQDIPPRILKVIRTVDSLSEKILGASSNAELNALRRQVKMFSAGQSGGAGMGSVQGIAQMLLRAVEAKRGGGNAAGIPVVEQLVGAAKSGARALIPAMQNNFSQQVGRNQRNMLNRNPG